MQRSALHDDADVDCGLMRGGADDYTAFAQGSLAQLHGSQHIVGQLDLTIDNDAGTGSGEVYVLAWRRTRDEDGPEKDLLMAGRYVDDYALSDGRSAIQRRRELIEGARHDPAIDAMLQQEAGIQLSGPRGADFSQTRNWSSGISGR